FFIILAHHPYSLSFPTRRSSDLIFSVYTLIMSFFGWSGTYSALGVEKMDVLSTVNLNYALEKHTAWNAPNPFTSSTLYHAFATLDRKSTRLNSSHVSISYAIFCL